MDSLGQGVRYFLRWLPLIFLIGSRPIGWAKERPAERKSSLAAGGWFAPGDEVRRAQTKKAPAIQPVSPQAGTKKPKSGQVLRPLKLKRAKKTAPDDDLWVPPQQIGAVNSAMPEKKVPSKPALLATSAPPVQTAGPLEKESPIPKVETVPSVSKALKTNNRRPSSLHKVAKKKKSNALAEAVPLPIPNLMPDTGGAAESMSASPFSGDSTFGGDFGLEGAVLPALDVGIQPQSTPEPSKSPQPTAVLPLTAETVKAMAMQMAKEMAKEMLKEMVKDPHVINAAKKESSASAPDLMSTEPTDSSIPPTTGENSKNQAVPSPRPDEASRQPSAIPTLPPLCTCSCISAPDPAMLGAQPQLFVDSNCTKPDWIVRDATASACSEYSGKRRCEPAYYKFGTHCKPTELVGTFEKCELRVPEK